MAKPTLLIVEDDQSIRETLAEVLEFEGYNVAQAENGKVALEWLAAHEPGLVLLDLWMPVLSGWQMLDVLRDEDRLDRIKVLIISAAVEARSVSGVVGVIEKPVELEALLEAIERHLGTG